jgi:hypothetical protein
MRLFQSLLRFFPVNTGDCHLKAHRKTEAALLPLADAHKASA